MAKDPLKLVFTPEQLKTILIAGMASTGLVIEDEDLDEVVSITEGEAMMGHGDNRFMKPVYRVTIGLKNPELKEVA